MSVNQAWLNQLPIQPITNYYPVSGGDINESYCLETPHDKYFMKMQPGRGKAFFAHEVEGLKLLSKAARVPKVITYGQVGNDGYLILKWYDFTSAGNQYKLGQMLARVHKIHSTEFGLDHDFKIGKIPKINTWQKNWTTFYLENRMDPLVELTKKNGHWNSFREKHYQNLRQAFITYYMQPGHKVIPSLLHGDFWGGNYEFTKKDGRPMLIDPDVYFGNREWDIAITTVFGGFNQDFYEGYNSIYPLKPGLNERLPFYQVNYLMCHLNLFGETYGSSVDRILGQY